MPWLFKKDIPFDKESARNHRFAMFGVFGFDLKKNAFLIGGTTDVLAEYNPPDPELLAKEKWNIYLTRSKDNQLAAKDTFNLSIGTLIRVYLLANGIITLHKMEILKSMEQSQHLPAEIREGIKKHYSLCYFDENASIDKLFDNGKTLLSLFSTLTF